jgi:hypothetical protein
MLNFDLCIEFVGQPSCNIRHFFFLLSNHWYVLVYVTCLSHCMPVTVTSCLNVFCLLEHWGRESNPTWDIDAF